MTFVRFYHLPPELRLTIFSHAIPTFHILPLEISYSDVTGFIVKFDHQVSADLPLLAVAAIRGFTSTCQDLRNIYRAKFPDYIVLTGGGRIHVNYSTTIIYLHQLEKLIAVPAISRELFDRNATHPSRFVPIKFPTWFNCVTRLALPIDCIVEFPEAYLFPSDPSIDHVERALFAKMLRPFTNLQCLSAVPDKYWHFDICLTRNGIFQLYPEEIEMSVLGKLAGRKEQLLLWAEYKNAMLARKRKMTAEVSRYVEPKLTIWGMEDLDLWAYLDERNLEVIN